MWRNTLYASGRGVLQGVYGHGDRVGSGGSVGEGSYFWSALTEIRPLMRVGITKPICHGTVGAVNDTSAAWMFDPWDGFLILLNPGHDIITKLYDGICPLD